MSEEQEVSVIAAHSANPYSFSLPNILTPYHFMLFRSRNIKMSGIPIPNPPYENMTEF